MRFILTTKYDDMSIMNDYMIISRSFYDSTLYIKYLSYYGDTKGA